MRAVLGAGAVALMVAGCTDGPTAEALAEAGAYDFATLEANTYRAYQQSYGAMPFAEGTVWVVATEHGALRTYELVPCRNGTTVCQGSAHGRAGTVEETPDYTIVRGLYGATFWLSPGGDGALVRRGRAVPLAWD